MESLEMLEISDQARNYRDNVSPDIHFHVDETNSEGRLMDMDKNEKKLSDNNKGNMQSIDIIVEKANIYLDNVSRDISIAEDAEQIDQNKKQNEENMEEIILAEDKSYEKEILKQDRYQLINSNQVVSFY